MNTSDSLTDLQHRLGYQFQDVSLLELAVKHSSLGLPNNERLEFLGDAALQIAITQELYHRFSHLNEAHLGRMRILLVNNENLAMIAQTHHLTEYIQLGKAELFNNGKHKLLLQAGLVEAIIGAVFLDGGYGSSHRLCVQLFAEQLSELPTQGVPKDSKTQLQELMQKDSLSLPSYSTIHADEKIFKVCCKLKELALSSEGEGSTRRDAEKAAAQKMLLILESS